MSPTMPRTSTHKRPHTTRICGFLSLNGTSCLTLIMLVCLETVLLSTVSSCAKTFYMHWNTSNSIFRIDNTDHIIDVNKGNTAYEFDQVHIICPVYEPGTFENETEKYIIYNVSKVEYETCRITNADPRVIAVCDKPHKLMFFTITFRPFTPQPGGLEFLPGNDYYFISTSSQEDLYRRIGGRCTTNNMKVVFKVCCVPNDQNTINNGVQSSSSGNNSGHSVNNVQLSQHNNNNNNNNNHIHSSGTGQSSSSSSQQTSGVSINTNIDQFSRTPGTQIIRNNNNGGGGSRTNNKISPNSNSPGGFIPQLNNINTNISNVVQSTMSWPVWGSNGVSGVSIQHSTPITTIGIQQLYPHVTSPRPISNSGFSNYSIYSPSHKPTKKTNEYDKHPNEVVKNEELTYNSGATTLRLRLLHSYHKPTKLLTIFNQLLYSNLIIIFTTVLVISSNLLLNSKYCSFSSSWWCER